MRDEILACGSISEEFDGKSMSICKQNVVQFCKFCDFDKKFGPDRPSRLATCLWYFYTAPGRNIVSPAVSALHYRFWAQKIRKRIFCTTKSTVLSDSLLALVSRNTSTDSVEMESQPSYPNLRGWPLPMPWPDISTKPNAMAAKANGNKGTTAHRNVRSTRARRNIAKLRTPLIQHRRAQASQPEQPRPGKTKPISIRSIIRKVTVE